MRRLTIGLGLFAWALVAGSAAAEEKAAAAGAKDAPIIGSDGVRRDPKGVKGISPAMELVLKGDRAFVARDLDGAIDAYRDAIKADPEHALAHSRLGAARLAKGDQKEAEAAFVTALRVVGKDASLRAKLLFALADLRERQKNNDEAIGRWKDYARNSEEAKSAVTYPGTASERVSRNETWKKVQADGAEVKARIAKRLQEAEEAARKSAADPKNR